MKSIVLQVAIFVGILSCVIAAQDSGGPLPKKPRTPDDYQARTLKELTAASDTEGAREEVSGEVLLGDLRPSRVRLTYKGPRGRCRKTRRS